MPPPATHKPLPCMPPCHACPPSAMHTPYHARPRHARPHPLWTDRHLWKHNLRKLRLRAVNMASSCAVGTGRLAHGHLFWPLGHLVLYFTGPNWPFMLKGPILYKIEIFYISSAIYDFFLSGLSLVQMGHRLIKLNDVAVMAYLHCRIQNGIWTPNPMLHCTLQKFSHCTESDSESESD